MGVSFTDHRHTTAVRRLEPSPFVAELLEDMAARWHRGERPEVEEYLADHPELSSQAEAVVQLINEEVYLRQEAGQTVDQQVLLGRFPQYRPQLEILLQCHDLLESSQPPPLLPEVGETLGDFYLAAELGRGAQGRVFIATQRALADRPLVLKVASRDGREHLALARLQHTSIVPLYGVEEDAERNLRILCMPYFGGANLDALLMSLSSKPAAQRTGKDLLDALDRFQNIDVVELKPRGPARQFLARCTYVEAVCWIGACLADALHYAHERDLLHLDLKPSNVLLTADAQPMLLDFHLARPPVRRDGPPPEWFGGTRGFMSPEQEQVLQMVREQQVVPRDVDHRSDVFGLGLVLYKVLGGMIPEVAREALPRVDLFNAQVSRGLADVIARCLAHEPEDRYGTAAELAADLRRHLAHQPLRGVANRSWRERWLKWRRRQPHAVAWGLLVLLVLAALGWTGALHWRHLSENLDEARAALALGQDRLQRHRYDEAAQTLARALPLTEGHPAGQALTHALRESLQAARQGKAAEGLHALAEQVRFLADEPALSPATLRELEQSCFTLWNARDEVFSGIDGELQQQVQFDLLDLAVLWSDLHVRLTSDQDQDQARRDALRALDEAEALYGPSPVLSLERRRHAEALGKPVERTDQQAPRTAWEHFALGRALLRAGKAQEAGRLLDEAVRRAPANFWANFYQGRCAYRSGRFADAAAAFRACITLEPGRAECYYNRALALTALKDESAALRDYDRALELNPQLAAAYFNRGVLHFQAKEFDRARADLNAALAHGADAGLVKQNLALVNKRQARR